MVYEAPGSRHRFGDSTMPCPSLRLQIAIQVASLTNQARGCCFSDFRSAQAQRKSMHSLPRNHDVYQPGEDPAHLENALSLPPVEGPDGVSLLTGSL